jgi:hypothetical protein
LAEFNADYQVREEDLALSFYHHELKDCETHSFSIRKCPNILITHTILERCDDCEWFGRIKCNTHNLIVCECGFQFGTHGKTLSKGYKYSKKSKTI